jgi:transposase, IS5 family
LAIEKSLEHNPGLKMMEKINAVVDWENIEAVLNEHYEVGKSEEGADAFPPLLLMKCMLLQKCFRIPSDPELQIQINDSWGSNNFCHIYSGMDRFVRFS